MIADLIGKPTVLDLIYLFFNEAFSEMFHRKVLVEEKVGFGIVKRYCKSCDEKKTLLLVPGRWIIFNLKDCGAKKREKKVKCQWATLLSTMLAAKLHEALWCLGQPRFWMTRNFMLCGCHDFENTSISSCCKMWVYQPETEYRSSNSYTLLYSYTTTTAGHSSCTEDHCELTCDPAMKKANRVQATIYSGGMSS